MKLQVALLVHSKSVKKVPQESRGSQTLEFEIFATKCTESQESQTDFKEEFICYICDFQIKAQEELRLQNSQGITLVTFADKHSIRSGS